MRFLTDAECRDWIAERALLDPGGWPMTPSRQGVRHARAPISAEVAFSRRLERALEPRQACLLWVTTWGVWPSGENLHLYYRLRQSYGDPRLLHEAPGHLFLDYEAADLVSYLQVGILCGWDMHLLPSVGYARAFVSHDEFVELAADGSNQDIADGFAKDVGGARVVEARA